MIEMSRRTVIMAAGGGAVCAAAGFGLVRTPLWDQLVGGRPTRTSFGWVTVLASSRVATAQGVAWHHVTSAAHPADIPVASMVHGAWTDAVIVDVEVQNASRRAVELSPGQFRVRVEGGPTVSLYSADREAGSLGPGATARLQIRYLAPPPTIALRLEFQDTGSPSPLLLDRVGRGPAVGV